MAGGTSGSFFIDCCIALFRFTTEEPFKIVDGVCCRREDVSAASPLDADGMVDDIREPKGKLSNDCPSCCEIRFNCHSADDSAFIEARVHLRSTHRPGIDVSAALERCARVLSMLLEQREQRRSKSSCWSLTHHNLDFRFVDD